MKNFFQKGNSTLLLINVFFLQSYLIRFSIGTYPSNLQEVLIGLNILSFIGLLISDQRVLQTLKNLRKHWVILSLASLSVLSMILVPVSNNLDFLRQIKFFFFAISLALIFLETFRAEERKNAIRWMGIGALCFGIFSVSYNILGYNVTHDLRLQGPLDSAVYLSYYLAPFFIFFTVESIANPKERTNILYAILLGLLIIGTRSMGTIAGTFVVIFLYLLVNSDLLKKKYAKTLISVLGIILFTVVFYSKILPTLNTEYSSLDERGQIWETSISILKEPKNLLFGVGFGQFQEQYSSHVAEVLGKEPLDYIVLQPHNIFLLFLMNFGILGALFLLIMIMKTTMGIFKNTSETRQISLLICSYFLIHGLIDTPIFKNDLLIIFIIFFEAALADYLGKPETKSIKVK